MKSIEPTLVLVDDQKVSGWIDVDSILYAAVYEGTVYVTMSNGDKIEMDPSDWGKLYDRTH
jgi:hypothetical protein